MGDTLNYNVIYCDICAILIILSLLLSIIAYYCWRVASARCGQQFVESRCSRWYSLVATGCIACRPSPTHWWWWDGASGPSMDPRMEDLRDFSCGRYGNSKTHIRIDHGGSITHRDIHNIHTHVCVFMPKSRTYTYIYIYIRCLRGYGQFTNFDAPPSTMGCVFGCQLAMGKAQSHTDSPELTVDCQGYHGFSKWVRLSGRNLNE